MSEHGFVTGIGGVFFKCPDAEATRRWYSDVFGLKLDPSYGGASFFWRDHADPDKEGRTEWAPFPNDTEYFGPDGAEFMINYTVRDLDGFLHSLESKGIERIGKIQEEPYGRFAWVRDPDGRRIELWEPPADGPA